MSGARGGILQVAYVCRVDRFDAVLDVWQAALGAGPFWVMDARPVRQTHRRRPTDAAVRVGMTYVGDLQVEVLAPLDDEPSAWSDWTEPPRGMPPGGLFHHVLIETDELDAMTSRLRAAGAVEGWAAVLSDGRRVEYVDARAVLGHYVEILEPSPAATVARERMRAACVAWDGTRPRRDYAELSAD